MIKSFKDFDLELNGQKVYESVDDIMNNKSNRFQKDDDFFPELISDNDKLLNISKIVFKKLKNSNIGDFFVNPSVVIIDGNPGVHFYNNDSSMNIIVCRDKYSNKYAYVFKKTLLGNIEQNKKNFIADFVLSTNEVGFGKLIDNLLSYLYQNNKIKESFSFVNEMAGAAPSWKIYVKGDNNGFTSKDFEKLKNNLNKTGIKELLLNIYNAFKEENSTNFQDYMKIITFNKEVVNAISDIGWTPNKITAMFGYILGVFGLKPTSFGVEIANKEFSSLLENLGVKQDGNNGDEQDGNNGDEQDGNNGDEQDGNNGDDEQGDENTQSGSGVSPVTMNLKRNKPTNINYTGNNSDDVKREIETYNKTMDGIERVASELCKYVKKRGKVGDINKIINQNDDPNVEVNQDVIDNYYKNVADSKILQGMRCLFVMGTAGSGKTHGVREALNKNGMRPNIDYYSTRNAQPNATDLYTTLYNYNGKLIIFDDSPNLFGGQGKPALWKAAITASDQPGKENENLLVHPSISEFKNTDSLKEIGLYKPTKRVGGSEVDLSRQERYLTEIGNATRKEKNKFHDERKDELEEKFRNKFFNKHSREATKHEVDKASVEQDWEGQIESEWNSSRKPLMPTSFNFTGAVIIITNEEESKIEKDLGPKHWHAIKRRSLAYNVEGTSNAIWDRAKNAMIRQMNDPNLTDDYRMIPKIVTNAFISVYENILKYNTTIKNVDFSIFSEKMNGVFKGVLYRNIKEWAEYLVDMLKLEWDDRYIEDVTL